MTGSCDQPGRLGTFTCFPELPFELQEQIWDEAIQNRHAEPLAHFFTLEKTCEQLIEDLSEVSRTSCDDWWDGPQQFGPPPIPAHQSGHRIRDDDTLEPSDKNHHSHIPQDVWDHPSNRSGYRLDSGLWGACVASRQAMVRNWRRHHSAAWCECDSQSSLQLCQCVDRSRLFRLLEDKYQNLNALQNPYQVVAIRIPGSSGQWIVTRPEVDLFICHVPELKSLEGWELGKAAGSFPFSRCHNVALYYDPEWASDLGAVMMDIWDEDTWVEPGKAILGGNTGLSSFARQFDEMRDWGPRSLWLIDERLEPVAGVPYTKLVEDRQTFKAAGQHFIQVKPEDMGQTWVTNGAPDLSRIDDPDERILQSLNPALSFVEKFQGYMTDHYHLHYEDDSEFDGWLSEPDIEKSRYWNDYAGMEPMVLACLSDEAACIGVEVAHV